MFENLAERLEGIFRKLRGRGKLTEADVDAALREVRLALLEADVNFRVVKDFIGRVREGAVGAEVLKSLSPGQQVIKIVHGELIRLMGEGHAPLARAPHPPSIYMLVGLHGSGKTTTAGKLALRHKARGGRPLLVPADVHRPAAVEQLRQVGEKVGVEVMDVASEKDPVAIARRVREEGTGRGFEPILVDTAGRLHIDEPLMEELSSMKEAMSPEETLLVADAMTGQDAVNLGSAFHEKVGLTGVILTKLDGDARGGAALSLRAVTGVPIRLVGVGEKLDALEDFHPDRMASRILGMGDMLSLIEKAEERVSREQAEELARKVERDRFTLEDFREQLRQLRSMGPLEQLLEMIPGMRSLGRLQLDERELVRVEAIINSMTPGERADPSIVGGSRRKRIALGSGTSVQDVNRLLKQFAQMRKMMKMMTKGGKKAKFQIAKGMFPF